MNLHLTLKGLWDESKYRDIANKLIEVKKVGTPDY